MKAILFADRDGLELAPLTHRISVALLPIAAKSLIEHVLETFILTSVREVILVTSNYAEQLRSVVSNGERWGLHKTRYVLSRGGEDPAEILKRINIHLTDPEYLVMRVDILCSSILKEFLDLTPAMSDPLIWATVGGRFAGIGIIRSQGKPFRWEFCSALRWQAESWQTHPQEGMLLPLNGQIALLNSLQEYHATNLAAINGNFPTLVLPSRQVAPNLYVGWQSQVSPQNCGLVGKFCRVHPTAQLVNDVVLNDDVIVDRQATLRSVVILPNTYIGEGVEVSNAIVWGRTLIRIDTGTIIHINDSFLLADLQEKNFKNIFIQSFNRGLGLLALFLSLPLWILAPIFAMWQKPRKPLLKVILRGNRWYTNEQGQPQRRHFTTYEWETPIPILRHLPKLLAVIAGHLTLVGVRPETPEQANSRLEPWEKSRDWAPIGLIGPCQLDATANTPREECLIMEGHFAYTRRFKTDLHWLIQGIIACFSHRAWSQQTESSDSSEGI